MKIVEAAYKKSKSLKHDDRSLVKHMIKIRIIIYYILL
jgi:hypothetical protein